MDYYQNAIKNYRDKLEIFKKSCRKIIRDDGFCVNIDCYDCPFSINFNENECDFQEYQKVIASEIFLKSSELKIIPKVKPKFLGI